eukprot:135980-Prorocentrum_minimum.AAC.1
MNPPDVRMNPPDVRMNAPDVRMNPPAVRMNPPDVRMNAPDVRMNAPDVRMNPQTRARARRRVLPARAAPVQPPQPPASRYPPTVHSPQSTKHLAAGVDSSRPSIRQR